MERYNIIRYPAASNLWAVQDAKSKAILIVYPEKGMCRAWIKTNGNISF